MKRSFNQWICIVFQKKHFEYPKFWHAIHVDDKKKMKTYWLIFVKQYRADDSKPFENAEKQMWVAQKKRFNKTLVYFRWSHHPCQRGIVTEENSTRYIKLVHPDEKPESVFYIWESCFTSKAVFQKNRAEMPSSIFILQWPDK